MVDEGQQATLERARRTAARDVEEFTEPIE